MKSKKVSQKQIAEALGVTQSLVSGVLNDTSVRVSEQMRRRILKKANSLGYRRNGNSNQNDIILFIVHPKRWDDFPPVLRGMQAGLESPKTLITPREWIDEDSFDFDLLNNIKGCVCASAQLAENQDVVDKIRSRIPLVFMLTQDLNNTCDTATHESVNSLCQALRDLWQLGHRRFGYFGLSQMEYRQRHRLGEFYTAFATLDYPLPDSEWVFIPHRLERTIEDLINHLREFMTKIKHSANPPSTIFFEADLYAKHFIDLAPEFDIDIPKDISVIGYDDTREELKNYKFLSTFKVRYEQVGQTAIELLYRRIKNPNAPVLNSKVTEDWLRSDSVGPAQTGT